MNEIEKLCEQSFCFYPEKDNQYPLCIGRGFDRCKECCLFVDFDNWPEDY